MRLIDADQLKTIISALTITGNYSVEKANNLCRVLDTAPTFNISNICDDYYNQGVEDFVKEAYSYLDDELLIIDSKLDVDELAKRVLEKRLGEIKLN